MTNEREIFESSTYLMYGIKQPYRGLTDLRFYVNWTIDALSLWAIVELCGALKELESTVLAPMTTLSKRRHKTHNSVRPKTAQASRVCTWSLFDTYISLTGRRHFNVPCAVLDVEREKCVAHNMFEILKTLQSIILTAPVRKYESVVDLQRAGRPPFDAEATHPDYMLWFVAKKVLGNYQATTNLCAISADDSTCTGKEMFRDLLLS